MKENQPVNRVLDTIASDAMDLGLEWYEKVYKIGISFMPVIDAAEEARYLGSFADYLISPRVFQRQKDSLTSSGIRRTVMSARKDTKFEWPNSSRSIRG